MSQPKIMTLENDVGELVQVPTLRMMSENDVGTNTNLKNDVEE